MAGLTTKLNDIRIEADWLANPHTLEIAEFAT